LLVRCETQDECYAGQVLVGFSGRHPPVDDEAFLDDEDRGIGVLQPHIFPPEWDALPRRFRAKQNIGFLDGEALHERDVQR
jgi:hypothetical protein